MNLRGRICYLLYRLHVHNPDCGHCNSGQPCWSETRKRIVELNGQTQPPSRKIGDREPVGSVPKL